MRSSKRMLLTGALLASVVLSAIVVSGVLAQGPTPSPPSPPATSPEATTPQNLDERCWYVDASTSVPGPTRLPPGPRSVVLDPMPRRILCHPIVIITPQQLRIIPRP